MLSKTVLQNIIKEEKLEGENLINLCLVNKYYHRSIIPLIKKNLKDKYKINSCYSRFTPLQIYRKMSKIKDSYKIFHERMDILSNIQTKELNYVTLDVEYKYIYNLLYSKYIEGEHSFFIDALSCGYNDLILASANESDDMYKFYKHITLLLENMKVYLSDDEILKKYGNEKEYHKKLDRGEEISLKDLWFYDLKYDEFRYEFREEGTYRGYNLFNGVHLTPESFFKINKEYLDEMWEEIPLILRKNILKEKDKLVRIIKNNYIKMIDKLDRDDLYEINKTSHTDLFGLSDDEIEMLLDLNDLVLNGVLDMFIPTKWLLE